MAADTGGVGAGQVVIVIHVAAAASQGGVRTHEREAGRRMIKRRARPGRGAVTLLASLRETGADVIGTRRSLEIFEVAADARSVRVAQVVIVVDVALRALHRRVRARERESGSRVVKGCIRPVCCAVALFTRLRNPRGHMVRIGRALEIF